MEIKESCTNWDMTYSCPDLTLEDQEEKALRSILHVAGDAIGAVSNIPAKEKMLREAVINSLAFIMVEARNQMEESLEAAMTAQAMSEPLEAGFTDEEVFGINLVDSLKELLKNENERKIAEQHFSEDEEDSSDEESTPGLDT